MNLWVWVLWVIWFLSWVGNIASGNSGSYLGWVISQVVALASLILESLCSKWLDFLSYHKISSSLPFVIFIYVFLPFHIHHFPLFNLFFTLFFFFTCSLYLIPHHCIICHLNYCLFSFPFWSELSHLLNHLVKIVSSENLFRVLTIIAKSKILNKEQLIKCAFLKSTHVMWYSEHGYFVLIRSELNSAL